MIWVRDMNNDVTIYLNPQNISTMAEMKDPDKDKKYTRLYMSDEARPYIFIDTEESIENIYQKIQRDLQRPRDEVVTRLDRILAEIERQGRKK